MSFELKGGVDKTRLRFKWDKIKKIGETLSVVLCRAICRGKTVGHVMGRVGEHVIISDLNVEKGYRRFGIATLLIQRFLKKYGLDNTVSLCVLPFDHSGPNVKQLENFYSLWGFDVVEDTKSEIFGFIMERPPEPLAVFDKTLEERQIHRVLIDGITL